MTANLAEALAKVQSALPTVHRGRVADTGKYSYSYADLSDVTAAVMPLLAKHGLAFACHPRLTDRGYELVGTLLHTSGESLAGALPLTTNGTPQQTGSAITYARRYLLGCLTGVVTDSDDDARLATEAAKAARRETHQQVAAESAPKITSAQSKQMHVLLGEIGVTEREKYLALAGWVVSRELESTNDLTKAEAGKVIDYLLSRAAEDKAKAAAAAAAEGGEPQ